MPSQSFEMSIRIELIKFLNKMPPFYIITFFFLVAFLCRCGMNAKISTLDFYLLEIYEEMNTNYCLSNKHLHNTSYVPATVLSVL